MSLGDIMSYIVLARKYRPQNFSEVYAQDHVTQILQSALESGRIAHAYLFTGPRGVGKTSLARIMAKSLNCETGPTSHPCNVCVNCTEITAGVSPDVIEIDGASNTGVDDIRELQRELLYAASGAKYKIYIIDEVHMLSKNAFNALLKTLEEPPPNVIFIFATTEPQKVLPTIISRCQRYDFKRIPVEAIVQRLADLAQKENITIDEDSLYLIARKADGGMRDALSLLDQTISYCGDKIEIAQVRQIFGMIPTQVYFEFMQKIKEGETAGIVTRLHAIFEEGMDLQEFLSGMLEYLRLVLLFNIGVQLRDIGSDEMNLYSEIAKMFSQSELLYVVSQLIKTKNDIKQSGNPYLLIEAMMIKLSRMDEMEDIGVLIESLKHGGSLSAPKMQKAAPIGNRPEPQRAPAKATPRAQSSAPLPEAPVSSAPSTPVSPRAQSFAPKEELPLTVTPESVDPVEDDETQVIECNLESLKKNWGKLLSRVKKQSMMAFIALDKSEILSLGERVLTLKASDNTNMMALNKNQEIIEKEIEKLTGKKLVLKPTLDDDYVAPSEVEIKRKTIDEIKAENPELAEFINETQARLV